MDSMVDLVSSNEVIDLVSPDLMDTKKSHISKPKEVVSKNDNRNAKIALPESRLPVQTARKHAATLQERGSFQVGDLLDGMWRVTQLLNFGADGEVYLVHELWGSTIFVLKTSHIAQYASQLQIEVNVYENLTQRLTNSDERSLFPTVVYGYKTFNEFGNKFGYMVITYFTEPFMKDYIHLHRSSLNKEQGNLVTKSLLKTVRILHKGGFVHHDLHGGNVVFVENGINSYCRLIDFGRAKDVTTEVVKLEDFQRALLPIFVGFFRATAPPTKFTEQFLKRETQTSEDLRFIDYSLVFRSFFGHKWHFGGSWANVVNTISFKNLARIHTEMHKMVIEEGKVGINGEIEHWNVEEAINVVINSIKL